MASVVVQSSTVLALTLEHVHQQCRIDVGDEDPYLEGVLIPGVCAMFEKETRCRLLTTTQEDRFPGWARVGRLDLEWGRVREVSEVTYLDAAGQVQTLAPDSYQVDPDSRPASVYVAPGAVLPNMQAHPAALRVRYVVGFGAGPGDVPTDVRLWLLMHVAHFWRNREASTQTELKPLPYAYTLIEDYRRMAI